MTAMVWIAMLAAAATAVLLTLAVLRAVQNPARHASFDEGLSVIAASEFHIDTAVNPSDSAKLGFFEYWRRETVATGQLVTDPNSPGKVALGIAVATGALTAVGTSTFVLVVPGVILGLLVFRAYLRFLQRRRVLTMEKQLPDLLTALRANLQAGATEVVALMAVADDLAAPLGDEMRLLRDDLNVSVPLADALTALANRVPSREMQFLASSIEIAHRAGADLEPQLGVIEEIVAQRTRVRQKLASAVAQVKPTELIAGLAIPGMLLFSMTNEQNREFWFSSVGIVMLVLVGILYSGMLATIHWMVRSVENL